MKVAFVVHCYFPEHYFGTEAYTRTMARMLRDRGHEPTIVTANFSGEPRQSELVERSTVDDIPVVRIDKNVVPSTSLRETYDQPSMTAIHERLLREIAPDVVHVTHLINHTASLLDLCARLAVPTFATFTDFFGFCFTNKLEAADGSLCACPDATRSNCIECLLKDTPAAGLRDRIVRHRHARRLVARLLARRPALAGAEADHIRALQARPDRLAAAYRTYRAALAPSRFLLDAYRSNGFSNLVLSHFGIDIDRAAKPPYEGARLRLGYIGQLAPHKGIHLLLDAVRALPPAGRAGLTVSIYGDEAQSPAYAQDLRRRADGLDVRFAGTFARETTAAVLADLDVLVIPSTWYENSPLILLQALATHTPVIIADVDGMTEFLQEGQNGFSFRRNDAGSLAAVLARFVANPALARTLSATTAYARTPADMADDLLGMYAYHGLRFEPP